MNWYYYCYWDYLDYFIWNCDIGLIWLIFISLYGTILKIFRVDFALFDIYFI